MVDWYAERATRGGHGKLVRRVFSILEERDSSGADEQGVTKQYFLVEGGFNVLDRAHHFGTTAAEERGSSPSDARQLMIGCILLLMCAEHENHLLGRGGSLEVLHAHFMDRLCQINTYASHPPFHQCRHHLWTTGRQAAAGPGPSLGSGRAHRLAGPAPGRAVRRAR